jgi:hypothetical protein
MLLRATGNNWNVPLYVAAGVYLTGAFLWMGLDPVTPLDLTPHKRHESSHA